MVFGHDGHHRFVCQDMYRYLPVSMNADSENRWTIGIEKATCVPSCWFIAEEFTGALHDNVGWLRPLDHESRR